MKFIHVLVAFSLFVGVPVNAQYTVNMRDADVRAFAEDAARVTGLTLVVDGRVNQKISVVTRRPLSRSEYFEVFLSTLRANGLVAIPIRGGYRIQPLEGAASQPSRSPSQGVSRNQFVTEIFRLRSIEAPGAIETLRPLISPQGSITANKNANSLVVADFADNVARIRSLIQRIDRNADTEASQIVYLRNVGPREIATSLQALAAGGQNGARGVTVSAIDSSNAVAIRGESAAVGRFAAMARELDGRAVDGTEIRVYWLEHADAEQLLPVLQQLVGQPVTQASEAPGFIRSQSGEGTGAGPSETQTQSAAPVQSNGTGIIRRGPAVVTRYTGTNAIIIAANKDAQRQLGEVIRQLDTRREQVLVEAIIVEIGDDAAKRLGVQFLLAGKNAPFLATNYSNAAPNIATVAGAIANYELGRQTTTNNDGTITTTFDSPLGQGVTDAAVQSILGATGGFGGGVVNVAKDVLFGAIINAVKSDTSSNLLSTPSIMTLDNQEAKLLVGQEVPITTGEKLSTDFDNAFRTVQRQNVGIQLDVKPQVNSSGSIKLFLRQEVSSVAGPVSSRSSDLIINKREFKTVLTVDDGDVLAIGGLLDENERRTIEKIPLLGDIPVLGELFKSRSRSKSKTNLMVFIRPTIVRTRQEARELTAQRYGYIRQEQLRRNPDVEPSIDSLVRDYMGAVPPVPTPRPGDLTYPPTPVGPEPMIIRRSFDGGATAAIADTIIGRDEEAKLLDPPSFESLIVERAAIPVTAIVDIPYAYAKTNGVVAIPAEDGSLEVKLRIGADPANLIEVRRHLGQSFTVSRIDPTDFNRHLQARYAIDESAAGLASSIEGDDELNALASGIPTAEDLLDSADDAPAIRLINGIIAEAVRLGVSDIHVEPYESGLLVRMRIDGVLRESLRMPARVAPVIVSRIKVMARLDIAERRIPQDGRISLTLGGKLLDVRVSTLPSRAGERVVLRILDKDAAGMTLELLGVSGPTEKILREALVEPNGIILVTGPTGSGKTTTLYACLHQLNDGSRNILTVEDPVEYAVDGVGQTQVNAKVGMSFAAGLRAILRQDPDVVMVGEIRDRETADIAVQASLTGHLVLSTVHTNDAIGAITRMRDMKVEPFLLASTLRAVIAQRLVRRLCDACKQPMSSNDGIAALLGFEADAVVYRPAGCEQCGQTGFKGRIGVFEAVRIDSTVRQMINQGTDELNMARHVFARSPNLQTAVREMVLAGLTTPEEAVRISRSEDSSSDA